MITDLLEQMNRRQLEDIAKELNMRPIYYKSKRALVDKIRQKRTILTTTNKKGKV